jgi:hypothetical protein
LAARGALAEASTEKVEAFLPFLVVVPRASAERETRAILGD